MSTALQLIQRAYQLCGYAPNEPLSGADVDLGQDTLNKMLDLWSNDQLMCYALLEQAVTLQPGKSAYTIGTSGGADVSAPRPLKITEGYGAAYLTDARGNNYPVQVFEKNQWNQLANRSATTTSNLPEILYYDPQFPLGILNVWPMPTESITLSFDASLTLPDMPNTSTAFSLPPGYELAIQSNLAVLLKPFISGTEISKTVAAIAASSKATIMRTNTRRNIAQFDRSIVGVGNRAYNVYTDSYR